MLIKMKRKKGETVMRCFLFYSLFMKIHAEVPRKILKRSYDCVDGELVNIFALTPPPHTG